MLRTLFIPLLCLLGTTRALAWGPKGHDVVAYIAECNLTPEAAEKIDKILGGASMVYWANWLDSASHTPEYAYTATWHYANVDEGFTYETMTKNPDGDIVQTLDRIVAELKGGQLDPAQEQLYLKMLIHLVGDLHQPMKLYGQVVETFKRLGGYASMPTCSHDIWRLNRMNRCTPEEHKVVITMSLTLPSPPVVYYGEEIGMRNLEYAPVKEGSLSSRNRSTCRTPMQWDTTKNAGFSTVDDAEKLYLPVDNAPEFPNVAAQDNDPKSVLNYVRGLIALRKATPALGTAGDWEYVGDLDNPYPMIYKRSLGDEKYVVVFNPSDRKVSGDIARLGKKVSWVYGNDAKLTKCKTSADKHTFTMQPVSVAIFKITE